MNENPDAEFIEAMSKLDKGVRSAPDLKSELERPTFKPFKYNPIAENLKIYIALVGSLGKDQVSVRRDNQIITGNLQKDNEGRLSLIYHEPKLKGFTTMDLQATDEVSPLLSEN